MMHVGQVIHLCAYNCPLVHRMCIMRDIPVEVAWFKDFNCKLVVA
jgi:hypothetical protein